MKNIKNWKLIAISAFLNCGLTINAVDGKDFDSIIKVRNEVQDVFFENGLAVDYQTAIKSMEKLNQQEKDRILDQIPSHNIQGDDVLGQVYRAYSGVLFNQLEKNPDYINRLVFPVWVRRFLKKWCKQSFDIAFARETELYKACANLFEGEVIGFLVMKTKTLGNDPMNDEGFWRIFSSLDSDKKNEWIKALEIYSKFANVREINSPELRNRAAKYLEAMVQRAVIESRTDYECKEARKQREREDLQRGIHESLRENNNIEELKVQADQKEREVQELKVQADQKEREVEEVKVQADQKEGDGGGAEDRPIRGKNFEKNNKKRAAKAKKRILKELEESKDQ